MPKSIFYLWDLHSRTQETRLILFDAKFEYRRRLKVKWLVKPSGGGNTRP